MACVDEFGIIEQLDEEKDYGREYDPEQYHCITVDDDLVDDFAGPLFMMPSYWQRYDCPEFGLARWGVTLIPPASLDLFYEVVTVAVSFSSSQQLAALAALVLQAKKENKFLIHYGV